MAGAAGSVEGQGLSYFFSSPTTHVLAAMANTGTIGGVNTTVAQVLRVSAAWSGADPANSITLRQVVVEALSQ